MKIFKKVTLAVTLSVFIVVFVFFILCNLLSRQQKIQAKVLVVEGWLPQTALSVAYDEFREGEYDLILLTGSAFRDIITLYENSFLVIYPQAEEFEKGLSKENHVFEIKAHSSLGEKDKAHFIFWVNDQAIANYYTGDKEHKFLVEWKGAFADLDSVMIQFKNDMYVNGNDRNLVLNSLLLNNKKVILEKTPRFIDKGKPFGKYRRTAMASSYAEMASCFFLDRGVEPSEVVPVPNHLSDIRRTYGNALALKQWFEENNFYPDAINVVSLDYHSQRTWMVYNRLLRNEMEVGIISAKNVNKEMNITGKYMYIARESAALLYYCLFIIPWE